MKTGQLQVWWVPQLPMKEFEVDVDSLEAARLVIDTLGRYDAFQFENNVKGDYCNVGGLRTWTDNCDGEGNPGWEDWYDEESGDDFDQYMERNAQ